jgi:DTW domain-containing protein YfiP
MVAKRVKICHAIPMARSLTEYFEKRMQLEQSAPRLREYCKTCVRPASACYCQHIRRFNPGVQFVILIHPIEQRRRIATGRMAHLSLENSQLIVGENYSNDRQVNALIENEKNFPVILFPGTTAANLSALNAEGRAHLFPANKNLIIFVIDGTWNTAKKTMFWSENLKKLPRICFSPPTPSHFRVRKQPSSECYSTIEAIHHTIELMGDGCGYDLASRQHDQLLTTFNWMVETQLASYQHAPLLRKVAVRHLRPEEELGSIDDGTSV